MNYWKDNGAPAEKLMVGFGAYAHTLTLSNPSNMAWLPQHLAHVPRELISSQPGPWPTLRRKTSSGCLQLVVFLNIKTSLVGPTGYSVCTFLKTGATIVWNAPQDVPYAYKGNQWIGYDNPKSFAIKINLLSVISLCSGAKWLLENNFGGAMVWAIDLDDFTGTFCGEDCKVPAATPGTSANQPATAAPSKGSGSSSGSSRCSNFCSGRANGLYPDPSNNHAFYHCVSRKTYLQFCQASLIFDSSCSFCNWA
ncbi:unnamed protein product [Caretta caretta]